MIRTNGNAPRGFTLVELLVVIAMIAIIAGSFTVSMTSAMQRARIQKATAEVKALTQALLAAENYRGLDEMERAPANMDKLSYLFGGSSEKSETGSNTKIPALIQASLTAGGEMRDPWGHPYLVTIRRGTIPPVTLSQVNTGYYLPNYNRLLEKERNLPARGNGGGTK